MKTGGVPPLTVVTLKMAPSHAKFSNQVPPRTSRSLISEFDVLCFMSPNPGPNWGARRDLSGIFRGSFDQSRAFTSAQDSVKAGFRQDGAPIYPAKAGITS